MVIGERQLVRGGLRERIFLDESDGESRAEAQRARRGNGEKGR